MVERNTIKLFQFNQKFCQKIGICVTRTKEDKFYTYRAKSLLFAIGSAQFALASVGFLIYDAESMGEYGANFFALINTIESAVDYFILTWKWEEILEFIETCEEFIAKRNDRTKGYHELNAKIEQLSEWFCFALLSTLLSTILFPLFYAGIAYYILDFGEESFHLYPPTEWPFDWRTPIGYVVAWFGEALGIGAIVISIIPFFSYLFGSCWLFYSIADDITKDLIAFNIDITNVKTPNLSIDAAAAASTTTTIETSNTANYHELLQQFNQTIQIYTDAKQCLRKFNEIYKYSLFIFYIWIMLLLSSSLVVIQFQLWENDFKVIEMVTATVTISWAFALNFFVCELGQWVTSRYIAFADELCTTKWFSLPIKMQQIYLTFLLNTTRPMQIQSYTGIEFSRETFKKINNKGFSYFITLRRMR